MTNETSIGSQTVDVLAVMEAIAGYAEKTGAPERHAPMLREARAAVAELIEAAGNVREFSADACGRTFTIAEAVSQPEFARLFAALARVGGAA